MSREANRQRFLGRHVLVTGAARGIGLEIASAFAREGARVHLFDVDAVLLSQAAAALEAEGHAVTTTAVDVSRRADVLAAVAAVEKNAPIDVRSG